MEATADTLINQVAGLFLSKIDKQNIDPNFLQKFMDGILGRLNLGPSKTIQQKASTSSKTSSKGTLVDDLKTVYKDLIKDSSYKSDYKKFLMDVLPKELFEQQFDNNNQLIPKIEAKSTTVTPAIETNEGRAQLIDKPVEPQKVIFDGFSNRGWAFFSERLPKILKGILPTSKPDKTSPGDFNLLGGGIALILGGLAALVAGLNTDGPFKGILKILSKAGIQGGIKMLEISAKFFIGGLKQVLMAPINLLDDATKLIGKIFGKEAYKAVLKPLRGITGIFTKMLSGLGNLLKPLLGKLPLIGTVISLGYAYTRFKSGDVIGGVVDVLSGIATIFPGVGTAIGIGLDVLNGFLDYKTGGATKEASDKKGGVIKGWLETAWNFWKEKILNIPLIKNITELGNAFSQGDWGLALTKLVRIIPGTSWILDWMGMTEEKSAKTINTQFNMISDFFTWIKESVIDKITNIVSKVIEWGKEKITNIISNIPGYNLLFGDDSKEALQNQLDTDTTEENRENTSTLTAAQAVPLADGGIVTKPTNAVVGEAGPEAVVPLEKYFNPQNLSLNNTTLEQIAVNTKDTNSSLKVLSEAIFKLVTIVDKKAGQGSTTIISSSGKTTQQAAPASVIANTNIDPIRRVRMQFA